MVMVQVLLISSIALLMLHTLVWAQNLSTPNCLSSTNYTASSQFQKNLDFLLRTFYNDAKDSIFSNATEGSYPDEVFGLFLCRGDVSANTCRDCINAASTQIVVDCPSTKEAIIWYDECLIRYSNTSFFTKVLIYPVLCLSNVNNVTEPNRFNEVLRDMLTNLTNQATSNPSNRMYAKTEVKITHMRLYGMVQCTPDLSVLDCSNCLLSTITTTGSCSAGKEGGRILTPSCNTRYELYPFLEKPPLQPPVGHGTNGAEKRKKVIIGISASVAFATMLRIFSWYCKRRKRTEEDIVENSQELQLLDFVGEGLADNNLGESFPGERQTKSQDFPLIQLDLIRIATQQFSEENKLGEGGFGPVYKGTLVDGKEIAVKRLSGNSGQGLQEFKAEVTLIARLQHNNLVKLLGCCLEGKELLLVYDYMPNKSLDVFLFDSTRRSQLDWKRRLTIINGIARGILYLHEDSRLRIIHRDLKASNILLDHEMNPKISDFGLARIFGNNQSEANTNRVVGTYGYMAPEYAMEGIFSVKSDVFSFGVLLLETVSGRKNSGFHLTGHGQSLLAFAWKLWSKGQGIELMDPLLTESYVEIEVLKCIQIGLLCVQEDPADRPNMSSVILMMGSYTMALPQPTEPAFSVGRVISSALSLETDVQSSVDEVTLSKEDPNSMLVSGMMTH